MKSLGPNLSDNTPCEHTDLQLGTCWHSPCVVQRRFRDGSVLLCNSAGWVKRFERNDLTERK